MKKVILKHIYEICYKILRIFIVSTIFWILANAVPETIPTPSLTEKLIDSIYYTGRKVSKITYEDLKRKSLNQTLTQIQEDFEILGNYYYEYIKQVNAMKEDLEFEKKKFNIGINEINFNSAKKNTFNNKAKEEIQTQQKTYQVNSNLNVEKDEKNIFLNGFHVLYGNKTIFKLEIQDVINLVNLGIIEESQAVFLWESLLLKKSQMKKRKKTEISEIEFDAEFFLFNFIPVKSVGLMIINIIIFLISYKIIRIGVVYNSFCILFTYYLLDNFYKYRYYGNSFISFITFVFCMKHIFFSIICRFNLKQEDIDIFTDKSKSVTHFFLKICGLIWVTLIIAIFSFVKFKLFMNYVIFYFGIILIINHVTEYVKYDVAAIFQPFKYFAFVSVGLINFLVTNFHKKISKFNYPHSEEDFFYFVSEIFSFFCISYLYEYLFTQANNISHLLFERNEGSEEFNKKLNQVSKEYKEHYKTFSFKDSLWTLLFLIGYGIFYMAISFSQYVTYIFGMYYLKMIINAFGRIYKVKILRCFYSYLIFSLILINHIVTLKNDEKITSFLNYFNLSSNIISSQQNISTFFRHFIRFIGVVYIIIIIFSNFEFIYLTQEQAAEQRDKYYDTIEKEKIKNMHISATFEKKKKKNLQIEFQIVKEEKTRFNFKNIIYIHFDLYTNYLNVCLIYYFVKDVEKNLFIMMGYFLLLFLLLCRVFNLINYKLCRFTL